MGLKLADIQVGVNLDGIEPNRVVTVAGVAPVGSDAIQLFYKLPDGALRERLLSASDAASLSLAVAGRPWAFDADGAIFQLAVEAKRIDLAFLFDPMMAVHTSNVEPLIAVLALDHNAKLTIKVEVQADFPEGAPDDVRRAVNENAGALGFTPNWE